MVDVALHTLRAAPIVKKIGHFFPTLFYAGVLVACGVTQLPLSFGLGRIIF